MWSNLYENWNQEMYNKLIAKYNFDLTQKVENYSLGTKTMFFLILAISSNAQLLILDEPTQHLDPNVRFEVMKLIKQATTFGSTVLLSSHEIFELEEYATDFAIIKSGVVVYTDSIDDAKEKHRVVGKGEKLVYGNFVGMVDNELLVRVDQDLQNIGRYPKLNDIVIGYLNSNSV